MTQSLRVAGKRCLVTAAGAGIGRATALAFAREGAQVLAVDIDATALHSLSAELRDIDTRVMDLTDAAQVLGMPADAVQVDVLVNCVGFVHSGSLLETTLEDWRRSFILNVESMFTLCRAVLPGMLARRQGSIVNMASVASSIKGVPKRCAYGASKGAVIGLTKSIAADYVTHGIRCNAICPGTVRTPSLEGRVAALGGDPEQAWNGFVTRQPMGRLGRPEEIASLAVYLGSDESGFVTGTIQVIDGGWSN